MLTICSYFEWKSIFGIIYIYIFSWSCNIKFGLIIRVKYILCSIIIYRISLVHHNTIYILTKLSTSGLTIINFRGTTIIHYNCVIGFVRRMLPHWGVAFHVTIWNNSNQLFYIFLVLFWELVQKLYISCRKNLISSYSGLIVKVKNVSHQHKMVNCF